jgi:hypothetical protein
MKVAAAIYEPARNVILSEAENLRAEMFRFAQHDNAHYWTSNHAS